MPSDAYFEALWNRHADFELIQGKEDTCVFAGQFLEWTKTLCAKSTANASIVSINQAKVLLVDKYFEWRAVVPKSHRRRTGKVGHECILQVFEKAYASLKTVELSLTPPMLFIPAPSPPPPPAPPPPQIAGVFIGELDKS